jgi:hypothetical protein
VLNQKKNAMAAGGNVLLKQTKNSSAASRR